MHSLILTLYLLVPGDEPIAKEPSHAYRWVRGDDPGQVHLYDGSKQIGTWRYDLIHSQGLRVYYPFDGTTWAKYPEPLPQGVPKPPAKRKDGRPDLHMPVPEAFQPGTRFNNGGSIGSDGHYIPPVGRGGLLIRAAPRFYGGR